MLSGMLEISSLHLSFIKQRHIHVTKYHIQMTLNIEKYIHYTLTFDLRCHGSYIRPKLIKYNSSVLLGLAGIELILNSLPLANISADAALVFFAAVDAA